jgi:hypothetical protein
MFQSKQIMAMVVLAACSKPQMASAPSAPEAGVPDVVTGPSPPPAPLTPPADDDFGRSHEDEWLRFKKTVAAFKISDGVSREEAEFLGEAYFTWEFLGCGFAGPAKDGKTEWLMRPRAGVRGQPDPHYIRIDKRTGVIRYSGERPMAARDLIEIERRRLWTILVKGYVDDPVREPANKALNATGGRGRPPAR